MSTPNAQASAPAVAPAPAVTATKTADPAALGLGAFALTTFLLSMVNAKAVNAGVEPVVFGMALAFGGLAQLLAGMWEFRAGNTFGATAFAGYGGFWLSFWAFVQFYAPTIPAAEVGHAVGLYLFAWTGFTAYMLLPSFAVSRAVNVVFLLLTPTFLFLAIGNYGGHENLVKLGGWLGIATAVAAAYASCAVVTNATFGRTVLPVKPLR